MRLYVVVGPILCLTWRSLMKNAHSCAVRWTVVLTTVPFAGRRSFERRVPKHARALLRAA